MGRWFTRRSGPTRYVRSIGILIAILALVAGACSSDDGGSAGADIIEERGFTDQQVEAALKTYMPSGEWDPYIMFASGGQSGQMFAIGVPSMRLLKSIAVFTPEPWQGWGYGNLGTEETLRSGDVDGNEINWQTPITRPSRRPRETTTASSSSSMTRRMPALP